MVQLMPHQIEAVERLSNGQVLFGGVGTGKSMTAIAYYMKREAPKDIYVITTARKRDSLDWEKEAAKFGIGTEPDATLAGVIKIDSWNNIGKYVDVEDAFFIFDEQRLVGHGAWVKTFLKIAKNNGWILLSATPGDVWLDYAPVFIANGLYRNLTEFKREHIVYAPFSKFPKIMRYINVKTLEKWRNMLLVEMPYIKHTERILEEIQVDYNKTIFDLAAKERWNPFEDQPIRDVSELFRVLRKIVNTDSSRIQAVREILAANKKVIVFYSFNYELEILRQLSDDFTVAEWNGHRKEPIPDTDSWVYLVQYVSGAEAWECIETNVTVFYSLCYSYKNFQQAQGRIDRLNTPFSKLHYYILMSESIIDKAIRKSLDQKRTFNENVFFVESMSNFSQI